MQGCLGIYIQKNLIKYAKISKEHNKVKVDAYGVKFYDSDVEKTIEQIVKETYSYQVPISVNIEGEQYTYSNIFNLLKKQDLEKAISTEFEFFCNNNNKNKNTLEFRRLKAPNLEDRDKVRVIYTYIDKANLVERIQLFDKYKSTGMFAVPTIIPNINKTVIQDNCVIVNIEENTEITTVINGSVYKVDKIEQGMNGILKQIAEKENSVKRAYEICKNTTVYTKAGQNLKIEGNEYLDEIITSLLEIIEKVRENIRDSEVEEINNIYITGMGLIINNIDLLFQENFIDQKCEILVPYFIEKTNVKINIKDYIEVNSAIALAMQGLEPKNQETNFSDRGQTLQKILTVLTSDVKSSKLRVKSEKPKRTFKEVINAELDFAEITLLRVVTMLLLIIILYIAMSEFLSSAINKKIAEAEEVTKASEAEIAKITQYTTLIDDRTAEYQRIVDSIDEANSEISENFSSKNAIPNLLNKIMQNIPMGVQLLTLENPSGKSITITAQANKYDQLGYFKAVLEEEGILTNITTTKGTKQGDLINITITGELPY